MNHIIIRDAQLEDAARLLEIYAYYVKKTAITFEYEVPSLAEFEERIKKTKARYPYLVIERDGVIEGYAVEGHVPLSAINWLLENKPKDVVGISTPGMPIGSPGMEQGNTKEEYPVVLLYKNGDSKTFAIYKGDELIKQVF